MKKFIQTSILTVLTCSIMVGCTDDPVANQ
ncbi:MAG: hypothetical protein K0S39_4390, partial [Paenibacillus sp.]|nr:hypothetical protein [Paenibacillus sp.]